MPSCACFLNGHTPLMAVSTIATFYAGKINMKMGLFGKCKRVVTKKSINRNQDNG